FATTLAHGLALLEAFDATHAALTNKELAERSGLSKATVSRLSLTLQAHGLLECGPGERRHRLASAALTLGYPLLAGLGIRREARWGMKQLADELGGSVSLGLRERARMIYVETSRSSNP
ncbi:helix-turn-helix domain-containing protein, partial [Verminephrobacter eiseniae]